MPLQSRCVRTLAHLEWSLDKGAKPMQQLGPKSNRSGQSDRSQRSVHGYFVGSEFMVLPRLGLSRARHVFKFLLLLLRHTDDSIEACQRLVSPYTDSIHEVSQDQGVTPASTCIWALATPLKPTVVKLRTGRHWSHRGFVHLNVFWNPSCPKKNRTTTPLHSAVVGTIPKRGSMRRSTRPALTAGANGPNSCGKCCSSSTTNTLAHKRGCISEVATHKPYSCACVSKWLQRQKIKLLAAKKWHRPTMWNSLKFPLFLTLLYHAWDKFALWYAQLGGHFITNVNGRANYDAELLRDAAGGFAATAVLGGQQTAKLAFKIIQYKCVKLNFGHKFRRRWWMHKSFHVRMVRCS